MFSIIYFATTVLYTKIMQTHKKIGVISAINEFILVGVMRHTSVKYDVMYVNIKFFDCNMWCSLRQT